MKLMGPGPHNCQYYWLLVRQKKLKMKKQDFFSRFHLWWHFDGGEPGPPEPPYWLRQ